MDKRKVKVILAVLAAGVLLTNLFTGCSAVEDAVVRMQEELPALMESLRQEKKPKNLPDIDINSWEYVLVNQDYPYYDAESVATGETKDQYLFDARAIQALDAMLLAGEAEGLQLALSSAWRSTAYQEKLFEDKVESVMAMGYEREDAEHVASSEVSRPGTSEHHLGLAADIVSFDYNIMNGGYAETPEGKWLREHCAQYGFILRYPEDKTHLTGVIFEPWHFRYVGTEAAVYIMKNGLCLEEFVALYQ